MNPNSIVPIGVIQDPRQQLYYRGYPQIFTTEQQQQLNNHQYWTQEQQLFHSLMNPHGFPVVVFYPRFDAQIPRINCSDKRRRPLREFWTKEVLNTERRIQLKKQTKLAVRLGRKLKRLQRRTSRRIQPAVKGDSERKEARERWRQHRYFKAGKVVLDSDKPKCSLWCCDGRRRRSKKRALRRSRSLRSVLSSFSVRSRTPINFRSSPIVNRDGFPAVSD